MTTPTLFQKYRYITSNNNKYLPDSIDRSIARIMAARDVAAAIESAIRSTIDQLISEIGAKSYTIKNGDVYLELNGYSPFRSASLVRAMSNRLKNSDFFILVEVALAFKKISSPSSVIELMDAIKSNIAVASSYARYC